MLIKDPPVEVADCLWMLGTNEYPVFLVKSQNEAAIFEGGVGATGPVVAEQIAEPGVAADSVKQVVITHAHPDHVMAVPAFREMFASVTVCASKAAAETLSVEKAVRFFSKVDGMLTESLIKAGSITEQHRPKPLAQSKIAVDRILADGDVVTVGGLEFSVLATPGHSDCSLSFHERSTGILIISDATGYYLPDSEFIWPNYFSDYGAYYFAAAIGATEAWHKRILQAAEEECKCSGAIGAELGAEVYEKTQLLSREFFEKNCELLAKKSLKYADEHRQQE